MKEVEYSRLFNIGDYSNERIGFRVEISEGEKPEIVIGNLFMRVLEIEDGLSRYREVLRDLSNADSNIKSWTYQLEQALIRMADLEKSLIEMEESDEADDFCRIKSVREQMERELKNIERAKEKIREFVREYNRLKKEVEEIKQAISTGDFAKLAKERPYLDAEMVISGVEAKVGGK